MVANTTTDLSAADTTAGNLGPGNPYEQYKQQALATLAPGELLVKLYEEVIKQMLLAKMAIQKKDYAKANDSLSRAQTIISTLASALDMRFTVSKALRELYIFLAQQLLKANVKKNIKIIDQCLPLVKDLRDAFDQAEKISRQQAAKPGVSKA